jgi:hypothetical protein
MQGFTWGRIADGVSVAGVSLAGLDRQQAASAISDAVDERLGSVRLETGGTKGRSRCPSSRSASASMRNPRRREP